MTKSAAPRATIVMYHYVRSLSASRFPRLTALDLAAFRHQIEYIRRQYTPVGAADLVAASTGAADLPDRPILLTFDDGYREHSREVFPFLQDRKIPAVFFPAASSLIDRHVLDVNKIQFVLAAAPSEEALVEIIDMAVERAAERKDVRALSDYRSDGWKPVRYDSPATSYIKCMLQGVLPADIRATLLDGLFTRFVSSDEKAFAEELYFTTEEAREMARGGATIGCHADRHVTLTSMPREGQAREIDGSLRVLEQIGLPRTPLFFSYAKGAYDSDSVDLLRARGCSLAVTNTPDIATLSPETMLTLPRLDANHLPSDASAPPHAWTLKA